MPGVNKTQKKPALRKLQGYPGLYAFGEIKRDKKLERRFLAKVTRDAKKFRADLMMGSGVF